MPENAFERYRRIQVETANPAQLVVLMYEGIARFVLQAAKVMEQADYEQANYWTDRASAIVQELLATLDFDAGGEVAKTLSAVYTMTIREILRARLRRDASILRKLAELYSDLKTGWASIASARAV